MLSLFDFNKISIEIDQLMPQSIGKLLKLEMKTYYLYSHYFNFYHVRLENGKPEAMDKKMKICKTIMQEYQSSEY